MPASHRWLLFSSTILGIGLFVSSVDVASAQDKLDRTALPIQVPKQPTYSELDVRNAEAPPRFEVKAPKKAPNVVIVLIDDVGFGATSTFGGLIQTPTLDRLARSGLRFNNFHTTALCSPTRMCIKTGRNHHTCNTGSIMETATAFPGNTRQLPKGVVSTGHRLCGNFDSFSPVFHLRSQIVSTGSQEEITEEVSC